MSLIKIKSGNSFPLICTLKDNGNPVNPANVEGMVVSLKHTFRPAKQVEFQIEENSFRVHITPDLASDAGQYRIVVRGIYLGESVNRDPIAFEIVSSVEKESVKSGIKADPVETDIEFVVGSIEIGNSIPNWDDIQGKPSFSAVASSGDYNDLENTPSIPTRLSDLEDGDVVENMGQAFSEEIERVDVRINNVEGSIPNRVSELQNDENFVSEVYVDERISGSIDKHNNSGTSHADIRNLASNAESIAKGKSRAVVFDTEAELDEFLSDHKNIATLQIGDNLYIRDLDAPDFWWDGEQKQVLGAEKVDLTGVVTLSDLYNTIGDIATILDSINGEVV